MMENTPDNGKNLMEEAVDIVRADRRAREEKKQIIVALHWRLTCLDNTIGLILWLSTIFYVSTVQRNGHEFDQSRTQDRRS